MKAEYLDYRRITGQNELFLRYLYDFESVAQWYPGGPPELETLARRAEKLIRNGRKYPRHALSTSLERFNRRVGAGEAALENIQKLRDPSTVAVVTGQQVGLFGGPALAIHKALTAVSLTRRLRAVGIQAIPVFWLASDDSDYAEVASVRLLGEDGELLTLLHPPPADNGTRMVGSILLNDVSALLDELESKVVRGEFRHLVLDRLRNTYSRGRTFSEAFGAYMAALFQEQGLVLYDALTAGIKDQLTAAYETVIKKRKDIAERLQHRSQQLEQAKLNPQVQVSPEETLLFLFEGEHRYKLDFLGGRFKTRGEATREFSEDELLDLVRQDPEAVGPNVLLRPILQDLLFPTVAYVAGPAETAYFAQLSAIACYGDVEPMVFPRVGLTLIDAKTKRLFEKYHVGVEDIVNASPQDTVYRFAKDTEAGGLIRDFEALQATVEARVAEIEDQMISIDPGMAQLLRNSEAKMIYQVKKVRDRFVRNFALQSSQLARHVAFLHNSVYPEQTLQERLINFNHFLILEGPSLIGRILDAIQPFCKEHQILYVSTS
ncbi:MAG TPA: bacillithiol biosynthesis cysteine-adding enzyme BshC [Acidobacteriota bacterium]|nr:bacillithiol biosynthesis cysteine-adding enzyme BshC [Acidobacteriota bacterium]